MRKLSFSEIESVSGGNWQNSAAIAGATLIGIAALPVDAPFLIAAAGVGLLGAAAGWIALDP
jgi:lactobin A/cerein 7B family class IIb bacteriocin